MQSEADEAFGEGEGGNVAKLSAGSISLCEWLFRGALSCAGAWGKCQCEPTSISSGPAGDLGYSWKYVGPVAAAEKLVSPC